MSQSNSGDTSKQIQITNNSSSDVVIFLPTTSDSPASTNAIKVYNQDLEILPSITGETVISEGGKQTFLLNQHYKDPDSGQMVYSSLYNLMASTKAWYYPVDNMGVMQLFSKYAPQTITKAEQKSIEDAATFYQTISAYPTSQLAKNYQTAMTSTQTNAANQADGSSSSSDNIANAISGGADNFFKSTKGFKDVTLSSLVAIESYYKKFCFVWAQYKKSVTYYLYSNDGKATSFVGTLSLERASSIDLTKLNSGYACTFTPASDPKDTTSVDVDASKAKILTYSDGLFVDDVNKDIPAVAVKGTFQLKRLFTQVPTDSQIITVMTGTIDGAVCIGFDSPQKSDDKSGSDYWTTLFEPKTSEGVFHLVMTLGGVLMMMHFAYMQLKAFHTWCRRRVMEKEPTTAEQWERQQEFIKKTVKENFDEMYKKMSGGKESAPVDVEKGIEEIDLSRNSIIDYVDAGHLNQNIELQSKSMEDLAELAPKMSQDQMIELQKCATSLNDASKAINSARRNELHEEVEVQQAKLTDVNANLNDLTEPLLASMSAEERISIENNQKVSNEIAEQMKQSKERELEENESEPEIDDEIIPEE